MRLPVVQICLSRRFSTNGSPVGGMKRGMVRHELRSPELGELLQHAEWLRGLAARLVRGDDADDVVQDTWAAAVRSPPSEREGGARPWLAQVARNVARRRWRSDSARRVREEVVGTAADPVASPEELVARAQLHRRLADHVLALDEPFRSTILLRYFEARTAAEIARTSGVPEGTVRWRIKVAVDRLCARLDEEHGGDRRRWCAVLAPSLSAGKIGAPPPGAVAASSPAPGPTMAAGHTVAAGGAAAAPAIVGDGSRARGRGLLVSAAVVATVAAVLLLAWRDDGGTSSARARSLRRPVPIARVVIPGGDHVAAAGIEGVVTTPGRQAVAGAVVALACVRVGDDSPTAPATATAVTDGFGRYAFEAVQRGPCQLTATARGFQAAASPLVPVVVGKRQTVDLSLTAGGLVLSGRVLDEGGGAIPGAVVTAGFGYPWYFTSLVSGRPQRRLVAIADEQGRFELTLEPREYTLRADAGGYTPLDTSVALTRNLSRDLALAPAARVEGRVIGSENRQPVSDADVTASLVGQVGGTASRARTDADGRFKIDDVPGGTLSLRVRKADGNLHGSALVAVAPTQVAQGVEIEAARGLTISGTVVDQASHPASGVRVETFEHSGGSAARDVTDASGRFTVGVPGAGHYLVAAMTAGMGEGRARLSVEVGTTGARDVRLVMAEPAAGGVVSGQVLAADGRPAAGALVRAESLSQGGGMPFAVIEADAQGSFNLEQLPTMPFRLVAWHPRHGFAEMDASPSVSSQAAPMLVRLAAGASIGGRVSYDDGAPAANVSVAVTRQEGSVLYDSASTDETGHFLIRSLAPGRYTVRASRKVGPGNIWTAHQEPWLKLVDVPAGDQSVSVDLMVRRGGKVIAGTAVLADGRPAAGARIVGHGAANGKGWRPFGRHVQHAISADDDGRWRLDDVEDDTYQVFASFPGVPDADVTNVVAGRHDVRLVFLAPASIGGAVATADGRPVTDYNLSVIPGKPVSETPAAQAQRMDAQQRMRPMRVRDSHGNFRVEALAPGAYDLKVTSHNGSASASLVLATGEDRTAVRLTVGLPTNIQGKVVEWETNAPLAALTVFASGAGNTLASATTQEDGSFDLRGLAGGGRVTVATQSSSREDRVPESVTVELPPKGGSIDAGTLRLMKGDWRARARDSGEIGVHFERLPRVNSARIEAVKPDSAAARAGLQPGDVIAAVNGRDLSGLGPGAVQHLMQHPPGTKVDLVVVTANGMRRSATIEPRAR